MGNERGCLQHLFKDSRYKTGLVTLCKIKYTSTRGFLDPEIFEKSAYYSFILKGHHTHAVEISIVKKPTKCLLNEHFPADLIMESLFSITLTTIPGTQSSLEHTSDNVDLERVLFRYSITCYLHE